MGDWDWRRALRWPLWAWCVIGAAVCGAGLYVFAAGHMIDGALLWIVGAMIVFGELDARLVGQQEYLRGRAEVERSALRWLRSDDDVTLHEWLVREQARTVAATPAWLRREIAQATDPDTPAPV